MTKGCLMVVGAIFTPLILFLLITGGVMLYHNIFNHDEHEFSLCTGDGEYGYRSIILCKGDTTIIIPHNAKRNREMEGKYFKFHDKNGKTDTKFISCDCGWWVIPCYVAEQKSDSDFMIVDQKPIDSIFGLEEDVYDENGNFFYRIRPNESNNINSRYRMLENSPIHQFWIIVLCTADVYGPLSYDGYQQKRTELGVSSDLRLKCEDFLEE